MGPVLSSLVHLQTVELELRKTKERLRKDQQTIDSQEKLITQLQATLKAKREEIKLTRVQYSKLELELRTREDEIAKLRVALNTAKTNRDYSAILTRINTDKAGKSKLEDQILQFMTQVDGDQAACRQIEQEIETESERLADIRRQTEEKHLALKTQLDKLELQHRQASEHVPEKEGRLFRRFADHFSGRVLAEVTKGNGRRGEHLCGGCFMSIPLESVNTLMSRDEMIICSNCGRILVLDLNAHQQPTG